MLENRVTYYMDDLSGFSHILMIWTNVLVGFNHNLYFQDLTISVLEISPLESKNKEIPLYRSDLWSRSLIFNKISVFLDLNAPRSRTGIARSESIIIIRKFSDYSKSGSGLKIQLLYAELFLKLSL
jgi:hypothetical protein